MQRFAPKEMLLITAVTHADNWPPGLERVIPPMRKPTALTSLLTMAVALFGVAFGQRPHFVTWPQDTSVAEGKTAVLNCSLRNLMDGSVNWVAAKRGVMTYYRLVSNGDSRLAVLGQNSGPGGISSFNLQIKDIEMTDEDTYECHAYNTQGAIVSMPALLSVHVSPQRPYIQDNQTTNLTVQENKVYTIKCHANRGKPAAEMSWHMNGQRLTRHVSTTSSANGQYMDTTSTILLNVTRSFDSKRLECQAVTRYMADPYRTSVTLDVQYAPYITMTTNVTGRALKEHDYVQFRCSGDANPQDVTWKWYRDGEPIRGANSSKYVIPAITPDYNENTISCEATNVINSTRQDLHLDVQYGAIIKAITPVVGADVGASATLFCQADGNPAPRVVWRRKHRTGGAPSSQMEATLSANNTLTIDMVTRDSFGWYECTAAVQGFPTKTSEAALVSNDGPTIRSEERQKATKGKSARLECIINSVLKPTRVTWSRKGTGEITATAHSRYQQELIESEDEQKSVLHIQPVRLEDFGFYNCTVENAYGLDQARLELVEKYEHPTTVIIITGVIAGFAVIIFVTSLVCVLYRRYGKEERVGSDLGDKSYIHLGDS